MIHFNGVCRSQFASPLCPFWFWIHFHLPLFLFFWGSQLSTNWGKRQCNSTAPEISSLLLATSSRASDWFISIWILSIHLAIVLKETKFQKTVKKDFGVKKRVFKNKAIDIRVQLNPNAQILQNRNLFFYVAGENSFTLSAVASFVFIEFFSTSFEFPFNSNFSEEVKEGKIRKKANKINKTDGNTQDLFFFFLFKMTLVGTTDLKATLFLYPSRRVCVSTAPCKAMHGRWK